ncbi:Ankyrin repeat domain-containing protein 13C [Mortierella sp. NVP85]|nr:Ankyrin repeat domain-containing protein 13C [Mortierella sp. NVP85]
MDHAVDPADPLALHKLVFLNKVHTLKQLLAPYKTTSLHSKEPVPTNGKDNGPQQDEIADKDTTSSFHPAINSFDHHLQTPLHLAVMLNRKDMVLILLEAGANPVARSGSGWTPRQEATSLGDRQLIEILTRHQRKAFSGSFETKAMKLVKQLSTDLDQFYFQLQWEFQSWVPFVSGLCPNDTYHIWKKGNCVRMDTSLVGFENMKWIRGHISIIFRVDPVSGPELVIVDRVKKMTQRLARLSDHNQVEEAEPTPEEIEEEVSTCFNSSITSTNVPTSAIKFHRAKTGLWGYRTNKVENVGEFECAVWKMEGVEFRTRVRTEHLKDEFGKPFAPLKRGKQHKHHHHQHQRQNSRKSLEGTEKSLASLKIGGDGSSESNQGARGAQPRRPIHQPLFSPFTTEPDSTDGNGPSKDGSDKKVSVIPKKHMRSTGTISDDAFFETALAEAEAEMEGHHVNGNGDEGHSDEDDGEDDDDDESARAIYRESLPPPPPPSLTFDEYFDPSKPGELHIGRPLELKETRKAFGATLWMYDSNGTGSNNGIGSSKSSTTSLLHENASQISIAASSVASQDSLVHGAKKAAGPQFPLTIEKILPLLEVVGMDNNRLVGKLREFLEFQLPPGFPIRANIPVYPTLSADVTFVNYDAQRVIEDEMFEVPGEKDGYTEGLIIRSIADDS